MLGNTLQSERFRKLPFLTRFSNHILVSATWEGGRGRGTDSSKLLESNHMED